MSDSNNHDTPYDPPDRFEFEPRPEPSPEASAPGYAPPPVYVPPPGHDVFHPSDPVLGGMDPAGVAAAADARVPVDSASTPR